MECVYVGKKEKVGRFLGLKYPRIDTDPGEYLAPSLFTRWCDGLPVLICFLYHIHDSAKEKGVTWAEWQC